MIDWAAIPWSQPNVEVISATQEDAKLSEYIHLLLDLAVIGEGGKVDAPSKFSKVVGDLMAKV